MRHFGKLYCLLVLSIMLSIEVSTAVQESQTYDEGVHLAAGLSYWRTGDFRLNPEHPPLVKLLASVPLLFTRASLPTGDSSWSRVDEWAFSDIFLYENSLSPQTMLMLGRLPIMILSLFLGWWIFKASREMFGTLGGSLSVTLYAFDPSIIAHGRYITTDLAFTALSFLSIYRLGKLLQHPSRANALYFGSVFVAATLTKFSMIAFAAATIGGLVLLKLHAPSHPFLRPKKVLKWVGIALPVSLMVIWACYGFDFRRPNDDPRIAQLYEQRQQLVESTNTKSLPPVERLVVNGLGNPATRIGSVVERLKSYRYPLYTFFRGATAVLGHAAGGHTTYLLGSVSTKGWWYYFPVAFFTKTPLPTLIAFVGILALVTALAVRLRKRAGSIRSAFRSLDARWILYTSVPTFFFVISLFSHLNLGWRHLMPVYPFLFVLAGSLVALRSSRLRLLSTAVALLLMVNIALIQFGTYPNEIGYFNSLVGGSRNGPRILLDSNLDWGQDLPKLSDFVRKHQIQALPFAYYGRARVSAYMTEAVALPTFDEVQEQGEPHGYVAISVSELIRQDGAYRWLWKFHPETVLGSGIYVYKL